MAATERLLAEQAFHDRQARGRAVTFAERPDRFPWADDAYLDHETWVRPAVARLGDLAGLSLLDCGCGHGLASAVFARRGARVTAFDLSHGYLDEARRRALSRGLPIRFVRADGHRLPFAAASFDRVWGNAVLHHLDLGVAGPELHRVLRPGGLAVFCEPWGENPLLNFARRRLPYPGKQRTPDEEPLRRQDLDRLRLSFPRLEVRGFQLVSMPRRLLHPGRLVAGLDWLDAKLLRRFPRLQRYCRYVVLTLRRS